MSTDILEELRNLFEWNTPVLQYAVGRSKSEYELRKARQVAFYDMHLAPSRTCKRVVHVPYLHKKIARVVDVKMQQICEDNISFKPTNTGNFRDAGDREEQENRNGNPLTNKRSVMDYYVAVTAECCLPVASALTFHPKFWRNIITWSRQPQCIRLGSYGSSLQVIQMDMGKAYFGPEVMDAEMLERLEAMEARQVDLATWEILSLSVEDTDAMLGVLTMAAMSNDGEFQWTRSSGSPCALDDKNLPKNLNQEQKIDAPEAIALIQSPWADEIVALGSPASILDASLRRGGSSFEAVQDDISIKEDVMVSFLDTAGSDTESDVVGSRGDPREKMPWTSPGEGHSISHKLIQRAWGQAVRQNTTLLVLHAGNYEYVCIRHRESQTLYISDILHIPFLKEPGYGKVQTAIYITAVEDALRRFALDNSTDRAGVRKKSTKKRPATKSGGRSKKRQRTLEDPKWCIQQAVSRDFLLLHIFYDIYDTTRPQIYRRASIINSDDERTPESAPIVNDVPLDARLLLFLNSELGQGNTGVVHGGILEVETESKKSRLPVAAKLSFSDEQRDRLQKEWSIHMYLTLEGVEGIPPLLGIFYDPEMLVSPLCLLTCHAGVSLAQSGQSITSAQRDAFLAVLQSIHRAGVHHGDIRYDNLLVKDSGEVAIIDFDRANRNVKQSSRDGEYHELQRLLDNKVDDSKLAVKSGTRAPKERNNVEVVNVRRTTRSMGAVRQTPGGMTLRPRR